MWDLTCLLQLLTWLNISVTIIILGIMKDGSLLSFFGIMKDLSLLMYSSASFNCFTYRNLFQNGANDMSEMVDVVNNFLSKSSKFSRGGSDHLILFKFHHLLVKTFIKELQIVS